MSSYLYQKHHQFFSQHAPGAQLAAQDELINLGAESIKEGHLGNYFKADITTLLKIVYQTRISTRVLAPLVHFECHSEKYLYKTAKQINWSDFLTSQKTFSINSNVSNSKIRNSKYASYILKDAIVDQFKESDKQRPNVDRYAADLQLNLYIYDNTARISLDLGGGSLHKRGYRKNSIDAPMQESLAATIIHHSKWDQISPIYDPFCGSGTLLIEAAMIYSAIPSAYLRPKFGFLRLPEFNATKWNKIKSSLNNQIQELPYGLIQGSDIDNNAVISAKQNCKILNLNSNIEIQVSDFKKLPNLKNYTIITNPPYGLRQKSTDEISLILKEFGDFLKQKCTGSTAHIYFGEKSMIKKLGLKPNNKISLNAGGLDGVLCTYSLY
ncbi:MAG: class I SAM-dependent RNA methyltransferase [Pontiellaceae bacterium]